MQKLRAVVTYFAVIFLVYPFSPTLAGPSLAVRDQLARIVDTECLPNFRHRHSPFPCAHVNLAQDYVISQDLRGSGHYLLIAISPLLGLENTAALAEASPRYFQNAWQHRNLVAATRGTPIDDRDVGILINPKAMRSQDRFHLHIAPLYRPFSHVLMQHAADITGDGTTLIYEGRVFYLWKISERTLGEINPVTFVMQRHLKAAQDMDRTAIMLVGAGQNALGENELYIIATRSPLTIEGWVPDDLLDWRSAPIAIGHKQAAGA